MKVDDHTENCSNATKSVFGVVEVRLVTEQ